MGCLCPKALFETATVAAEGEVLQCCTLVFLKTACSRLIPVISATRVSTIGAHVVTIRLSGFLLCDLHHTTRILAGSQLPHSSATQEALSTTNAKVTKVSTNDVVPVRG